MKKAFLSLWVVLFCIPFACGEEAKGTLKTLSAFCELTNAEASKGLPVSFEATVIYYRPSIGILFVQDGDQGIYVSPQAGMQLDLGDRILVRGKSQESFRPIVVDSTLTLLHHGALPQAVPATFEELIRGQHDAVRVKVRARLRAVDLGISASKGQETRLQLLTESGPIEANLNGYDPERFRDLLDAEVEIAGVSAGLFDDQMHITGVDIYSAIEDVQVLQRAKSSPWSMPPMGMDKVMSVYKSNDMTPRVRVRGVITYYQPGSAVVIQDGKNGIWLDTHTRDPLRVGDLADGTGFPDARDRRLTLTSAEVRDSHVSAPIVPQAAAWHQLSYWGDNGPNGLHNDLVSIEGRVITAAREDTQDEFVLLSDGRLFTAVYRHPPSSGAPPPMLKIPLGSKIRVTGICVVVDTSSINFNDETSFDILLRSFDDITVVANPPLLNVRNLILVVSFLILAVLAVGTWGWLLRKKVRQQTADLNHSLEKILEKSNQVTTLLNNSGEGFLSFGADLIVDPQYSRACETLLGGVPAGREAGELLFGNDARKADLLRQTVPDALEAKEPMQRELMLSLLPTEVSRDELQLRVQYAVLENGHVMVILKDTTEERRLAKVVESERKGLEMIVAAVTQSRDFFDTVAGFRCLVEEELPALFDSAAPLATLLKEVYRKVHTFKGLLNEFSFEATPRALHELEGRLGSLRILGAGISVAVIADAVRAYSFLDLLEADLAVIKKALGEEFLTRGDSVVVSLEQARLLEDLVKRLRRGEEIDATMAEMRCLFDQIEHLSQIRLQDALAGFDRVLQQAAARFGKEVAPLSIHGDDPWIDRERYRAFLQSLVHVFRNAVVHGIEDPEARFEAGKEELGRIACSVVTEGGHLRIIVEDDGAGVDIASLRRKTRELGIFTPAMSENAPDEQILSAIFLDNISTVEKTNEFAGRGVGLAAVRKEVNALGGEVQVVSRSALGTRFIFRVPLAQPEGVCA
jgi:signal transduction histidine kinase